MSASEVQHRYGDSVSVKGTLSLLSYFRDFFASGLPLCQDPLDRHAPALTREGARAKLKYMLEVAILRKSGEWPQGHRYRVQYRSLLTLERPEFELVSSGYAPLNHRGAPCRKFASEYQTNLARDAASLRSIAGRVRVYHLNTPELARRFAHLLSSWED